MKSQYVVVNETEHWGAAIRSAIGPQGRIMTAYLFDSEVGTYLCEMIPSYHLHPIHTWYETDQELSDEDSEWLNDALQEDHEDIYMHTSDVRALSPKDVTVNFPDDTFDDLYEYCVANCGSFT